LGDDPPERVVCPACTIAINPDVCDLEEELDKPKCLDTQTLEAAGSSCLADSIVRVCVPFICGAEVVDEETGQTIALDFGSLPVENSVALGCNTITDGSFTYTNIEGIPPSGTLIWIGTGEGTFGCGEGPFPTPTP
ncbi:MAG TPA: hypothetical protein VHT73_19245, partial [Thermodesulfobacteriota bacterium]|nr:hypothetical protein [Thermodesulfobacteriota bacterium]